MMNNTGSHKGLPLHAHDRPNWYGTLSHCGGTTVDSDEKTTLENELLFAVVKERYGSLLTDEQLDEVRKSALGLRSFTQPLRSIRLTNDIEPFSTFRPYRGD